MNFIQGLELIQGILMLGKDVTENHQRKSDAWENADTLDLSPRPEKQSYMKV